MPWLSLRAIGAGLLHLALLWTLICNSCHRDVIAEPMSRAKREELKQLTKDLWYHAFQSYMDHAYPADELKPLSCTGLSRDGTLAEHEINDVMGGYALTLIDALDSFVILGDKAGFEQAVRLVIDNINFDIDARVQVFEVTIRVLGGLLSAHLHATSPRHGFAIDWYTDELLLLAHDLGRRLLPAFQHSLTGLPWARINLRHGLSRNENMETCSAGAGSLLLEFATLSRLTDDPVFEQVARKALFSLWNRRSDLSLLGNTLNVQTGLWNSQTSSIGAGIDSFYEYLGKAYILLGDDEYFRIWQEAYGAVMKHIRSNDGFWYRSVNMNTGQLASVYIDALSNFFPGLQVLMGDLEAAIKSHALFALLWERYSGTPELFSIHSRKAESHAWPLRPELVESTYMLYRATKDDSYLAFGERVLYDISNRTKVSCGIAALESVSTGQQQDRMHSFVIAETLPYLYLLFDENNPINADSSNSIFTTEGHQLFLDKKYLRAPPKSRKGEVQFCRKYNPAASANANHSMVQHDLQLGIPYRRDMEYARSLAAVQLNGSKAMRSGLWSESAQCEAPSVEDYVLTLLFASNEVAEDTSPSSAKVELLPNANAFIIHNIQGLRLQITRRLDDSGGYDVTRIGPYRVSSSSTVFFADSGVLMALRPDIALRNGLSDGQEQNTHVQLDILVPGSDPVTLRAARAGFGPAIDSTLASRVATPLYDMISGSNAQACNAIGSLRLRDSPFVMVAQRGSCTFVEKMRNAANAGASALITLSDEKATLIPSADLEELASVIKKIPVVLLPRLEADTLRQLLNKSGGNALLKVSAPTDDKCPAQDYDSDLRKTPVVVNGHLLVNCKLGKP